MYRSKMKVLVLLVLLGLFAQLCESHPGGGDPSPSDLKKRKHDELESVCEDDNMEIDPPNPDNSHPEDYDADVEDPDDYFDSDLEEEDPDYASADSDEDLDASAESDEENLQRPKSKKQKTEKKRQRGIPGSKKNPPVIAEKKDWAEDVALNNIHEEVGGRPLVEVTVDLNEFLKDFRAANDLESLREIVSSIGDNQEAFEKGFNKLKPTRIIKGTNSYNYALVLEDLRDGVNFEKGKQHLLYWGKGVGTRVYSHFALAAFYNHIDKVHPGKSEKPRPFLNEALAYFLRFPGSYRVGYIKFNDGLSDEDVQKYEAALIQMKSGVKETFQKPQKDGEETSKYVRLLNVNEDLSRKGGMSDLSAEEINAIIYQAFTREGGFQSEQVIFVTQEEAENFKGFEAALKKFEEVNHLAEDKLVDGVNNKETIPFAWVKSLFCPVKRLRGGSVPNELKLLNLLMIRQEKTIGAPIGEAAILNEFRAPFYKELGFDDPKYFKKHKNTFSDFRSINRRVPKFILEAEITLLEKRLSNEKKKSPGAQKILNKDFQAQIKQQADEAIHDNRIRMFRLRSAAIFAIQAYQKAMKPSHNLLWNAWKLMKNKFEKEHQDLQIPNFYDGDANDAKDIYNLLYAYCTRRMKTNDKLTRDKCYEDYFSYKRKAFNLGDEEKFIRFRTVLEEAVNSVLDLSGDSKINSIKFHLLLRGICNVTRIPYRVLDSETGEEIEIDHPFYESHTKPTNGLLYYNIQRLIINHFPELLPVPRITKTISFFAGKPRCYEIYGCEKFSKPLIYDDSNSDTIIKCKDRLGNANDDKKRKKGLKDILDGIYANPKTEIEEKTRKEAGLDEFPKLVSDVLYDFDWVDYKSEVEYQTEKVNCEMIDGSPVNLASIDKVVKTDLLVDESDEVKAIYEPFEEYKKPAEKKKNLRKKKKDDSDDSEDDSDDDSEDEAPPKSSTGSKSSTSKNTSTGSKPSTSKGTGSRSKSSTSKGTSSRSKSSTSRNTSTGSKPSTSKGTGSRSKSSTSKSTSNRSKKKKKADSDSDPDYNPGD